jgi:hypothetical protein
MEAPPIPTPVTAVDGLWRRAASAAHAVLDRSVGPRERRTLPRLADRHPWSSQAPSRWRGLAAVPVSAIVGTASFQAGTRTADFQPAVGHEPADWKSRWQRLEAAARDLTPLPPIDLIKVGDGYWVVDGHNRVALAKANGQAWIDAEVIELLPVRHPAIARAPLEG